MKALQYLLWHGLDFFNMSFGDILLMKSHYGHVILLLFSMLYVVEVWMFMGHYYNGC